MPNVKNRVLSGLIVVLPGVATLAILYWLFITLKDWVLDPIASLIADYEIGGRVQQELPTWWEWVVSPLISITLILMLLYLLGYLIRSRIVSFIEWIFLRVPIAANVYQAVDNLIQSLGTQSLATRFKRVVLVTFPHPGLRSLGMVTNTLKDQATGRSILCVVVLTGVFPPTGFTLYVPEEDVTDIDWTVNQTLQAVISGGITTPLTIGYFPVPAPSGEGDEPSSTRDSGA